MAPAPRGSDQLVPGRCGIGGENVWGNIIMPGIVVRAAAVCSVLLLWVSVPALADFEAGQRAWDAGDPVEALAQWSIGAEEGDPRAMLALGRLYREGLGVLQDFVEAYKWFNLAASRGNAEAASERNETVR